jgi:hypothetical protein
MFFACVGGISTPDPTPEDALQAYSGTLKEDGARLSFALPPAQSRKQPTEADHVGILWIFDGWPLANDASVDPITNS